ncbi:MAG: RIO1 family regulatory kinase/ATPase [Candidatus Caldarchaeum sp.]|nr:RIO1 family regulatory kinase/ATPase [Candidatus Caldarchaeum sp.]
MSSVRGGIRFIELDSLTVECEGVDLRLLAYPTGSAQRVSQMISELLNDGVALLAFHELAGRTVPFLVGKGVRGMVFLGQAGGKNVAVKILRQDAAVKTMKHEAENQLKANTIDVGPKLLTWSTNVIVMEYVEGVNLGTVIQPGISENIAAVIDEVFEQTYRLDGIHLDHGQLVNASDHVIVSAFQKPVIIDYSHASQTRKPRNVTAFASFLIRKINPQKSKDPYTIDLLKKYKLHRSKQHLEEIKHALKDP